MRQCVEVDVFVRPSVLLNGEIITGKLSQNYEIDQNHFKHPTLTPFQTHPEVFNFSNIIVYSWFSPSPASLSPARRNKSSSSKSKLSSSVASFVRPSSEKFQLSKRDRDDRDEEDDDDNDDVGKNPKQQPRCYSVESSSDENDSNEESSTKATSSVVKADHKRQSETRDKRASETRDKRASETREIKDTSSLMSLLSKTKAASASVSGTSSPASGHFSASETAESAAAAVASSTAAAASSGSAVGGEDFRLRIRALLAKKMSSWWWKCGTNWSKMKWRRKLEEEDGKRKTIKTYEEWSLVGKG